MPWTSALRAHHDAAEALFDEILDALDSYRGDEDAYPLSLKLARLAGILRTHFAIEDEILYPRMIESGDREAAILARIYQSEHGQLGKSFEHFVQRWASSDAIAAAVRQFRFEAGMLFAAIRDRIHRENRDLYPAAEKVLEGMTTPPPRPPIAAPRFGLRATTAATY